MSSESLNTFSSTNIPELERREIYSYKYHTYIITTVNDVFLEEYTLADASHAPEMKRF